jgi:metal-sulfur cluster biosynthetic enzyme
MRDLRADVQHALESVHDPCSLQTQTPLSIVQMGLVRKVEVSAEGDVHVLLAVTSPGCTLFPSFARAASEQIAAIDGVRSVDIDMDPTFAWSPADIALPARRRREQDYAEGLRAGTVRPRAWKQDSAA